MQRTKRIGEFLSQLVPLSHHDIDEILHEQRCCPTRKTFGDVALSLGLCRPEHVWKAWCGQLVDGPPRTIDLDRIGIDAQALTFVSPQTAHELRVVPVRVCGDHLIVAISSDAIGLAATHLPARVGKQIRFALAEPGAVRRALARYYPLVLSR